MKRIMMILSSLCALVGCKGADFQSVDAESFAQIIQDSTIIRLDVRTPNEYQQGHIPGAILIDVTQSNFLEQAIQQLPKSQTIALYCRSGRRSKVAAQILAKAGYTVVELNTGFNRWNGEVVK